jgi:Arc/MetJ-type ribon-helix-helix transcriptional regulator
MSSDLSPQNEQFIEHAVASGLFPSRQAALDAAVESLRTKRDEPQPLPPEHATLVEDGLLSLNQGLGVPWDAESAKQRVQHRLASST